MMFGFFRRQPSAYAVAIRESMRSQPEMWRRMKIGFERDAYAYGEVEFRVQFGWRWNTTIVLTNPRGFLLSRADRRCIREGIEAWVAWSVSNQKAKV